VSETGGVPIDVRRVLEPLVRRKHLIATFTLSATVTSLALTYVLSEKYRAYTVILYRPQEAVSFRPKAQEALGFPPPLVPLESIGNTIDEVAKSDGVLEKVVRALHLDDTTKKPEPNWFKAAYRFVKDEAMELGGNLWSLLKYGRVLDKDPFAGAMATLRKNVTVKRTAKAYTFRLEVLDKDAARSAAIVDAVGAALQEFLASENMRVASEARTKIEVRLRQNQDEAAALRSELDRVKSEIGVSALGEEISLKLKAAADFEEQLTQVQNDLAGGERRLAELTVQIGQQQPLIQYMSTTENPVESQLRRELASLETERSGLLEKYTARHPVVKALDAKVAEIKDQLDRKATRVASSDSVRVNDVYQKLLADKLDAEAEIGSLRAKQQALGSALLRERSALRRLTEKEPRLSELTLKLEAAERSHQLINEAFEEVRLAESKAASGAAILHPAFIPGSPARPIKILHVGVSFALSLAVAIGAAFLFDFFDPSLRRIGEVESLLGLPVLATIPARPAAPGQPEADPDPLVFRT
jgi:uncharacterized protein involved in exopolysaccharide biosynthesis